MSEHIEQTVRTSGAVQQNQNTAVTVEFVANPNNEHLTLRRASIPNGVRRRPSITRAFR